MSKVFCIIMLLAGCMASFAQGAKPDCGWYGTKTVAQRNMLFPFNVAKKVVLVSYPDLSSYSSSAENAEAEFVGKKLSFTIDGYNEHMYLLNEEVVLNEGWTNQLSHVLVNFTLNEIPQPLIVANSSCCQPRNAILFYDDTGTIICCYEICFTCAATVMMPDPEGLNGYANAEDCTFKRLDELKTIFRNNGITYGIDEK
jgi:hypothetical protein